MIPILTKHLTEHHMTSGGDYPIVCRCGEWAAVNPDMVDIIAQSHAAHVAATFQAALDAAGATTRTEWGVNVRTCGNDRTDWSDGLVSFGENQSRAKTDLRRYGGTLVSRTVVTMPWQPAEEVEA